MRNPTNILLLLHVFLKHFLLKLIVYGHIIINSSLCTTRVITTLFLYFYEEKEKDDGGIDGLAIFRVHVLVSAHFISFEGLTMYRNTRRAGCVSGKASITVTTAFKSSRLLYFLGLNGCVGAIPT